MKKKLSGRPGENFLATRNGGNIVIFFSAWTLKSVKCIEYFIFRPPKNGSNPVACPRKAPEQYQDVRSGTMPVDPGTIPDLTNLTLSRSGTVPVRSGILTVRSRTLPVRSRTLPVRSRTLPVRSGIVPGSTGTVPDLTGSVPDVTGIVPDLTGTVQDLTSTVPDLTSTVPDVTGSVLDLDNVK
jgi:hypothetical protein